MSVYAAAMPHLHSPFAADRHNGTCREVEAVSYTYLRREWQILDQGVAGDFQQVCLPLPRVSEPDHAAPTMGCFRLTLSRSAAAAAATATGSGRALLPIRRQCLL